jgi:hypothetical protein
MKTFVVALGLAALATAQGVLPACAQSCALNAIGNTGCAVTDAACICTKPAFLTESQTCIESSCGPADQQAALEYAVNFCATAGVTLSVPGAPESTPASPPPSSAASSPPAPASTTEAPEETEESSAPAPTGPPVSVLCFSE